MEPSVADLTVANAEEAVHALQAARDRLRVGDLERAARLARKSFCLAATPAAGALVASVKAAMEQDAQHYCAACLRARINCRCDAVPVVREEMGGSSATIRRRTTHSGGASTSAPVSASAPTSPSSVPVGSGNTVDANSEARSPSSHSGEGSIPPRPRPPPPPVVPPGGQRGTWMDTLVHEVQHTAAALEAWLQGKGVTQPHARILSRLVLVCSLVLVLRLLLGRPLLNFGASHRAHPLPPTGQPQAYHRYPEQLHHAASSVHSEGLALGDVFFWVQLISIVVWFVKGGHGFPGAFMIRLF
ncbi:MAG: hypothetical protein EOO41_00795 [Methanobacteriota archaeon]|nr:MAG: hypothetical protein EOO41_00795 [Euryarchaeota archaeon]